MTTADFKTDYGDIIAQTDLLGNPIKPLSGSTLEFHPWEVKTVKIIKKTKER